MLTVNPKDFAAAVEALMIAARTCTDPSGLKVHTSTPCLSDGAADWQRIRAITLGAIVALVNGAAVPGDEAHLSGLARRRGKPVPLGAAMRALGEPPLIDIHKKR